MKKFLGWALVSGLSTYGLINYFYILPLKSEIASLRLQTEIFKLETEKIRNEMEPIVSLCQLKNKLDPEFNKLMWPIKDTKTFSNFELYDSHVEISVPPESKIIAVAKGTIVSVSVSAQEEISSLNKNIVIIDHDNHLLSIYAVPSEILVEPGQLVSEGDVIGHNSEKETSVLHFELRHCYREINPVDLFQN